MALALDAEAEAGWTPALSPRARANPQLNHWLAQHLPRPAAIQWTVTDGGGAPAVQSFAGLDLEPIDIVLMSGDRLGDQSSELERFLIGQYRIAHAVPDDRVTLVAPTTAPFDPATTLLFRFHDRRHQSRRVAAGALSPEAHHGTPFIGGVFGTALPPGEFLAMLALDDAALAAPLQAGLLIDEWTETVPTDREITGVAFNVNRPNATAPQAVLVAVPATLGGHWTFDDLVGAVHEALDLAQLRAVEPDALIGRGADQSAGAYFQALPAILTQFTAGPPCGRRFRRPASRL